MAVLQTLKEEKEDLQQKMRAQLEKSERNQVLNCTVLYCNYCTYYSMVGLHVGIFCMFVCGVLALFHVLNIWNYALQHMQQSLHSFVLLHFYILLFLFLYLTLILIIGTNA